MRSVQTIAAIVRTVVSVRVRTIFSVDSFAVAMRLHSRAAIVRWCCAMASPHAQPVVASSMAMRRRRGDASLPSPRRFVPLGNGLK